jgi:predicted CXXCH cytochrome family protein
LGATLYRDGDTIFISWKTSQPLYGWVELQELEGLNLSDLSESESDRTRPVDETSPHPDLRSPEDLAITVCYQCHPDTALGNSHPVRLFGGRDVRIPLDLPTVDGMLTCVTCHNPHGSEGKMLVRETIKTKLCVACHFKYKNSSPSTMFD